jgi:hypothetical protein
MQYMEIYRLSKAVGGYLIEFSRQEQGEHSASDQSA